MNSLQDQFLQSFPGEPLYYGNAAHAFYDLMVWVQDHRPKDRPNIIMPAYIPAKLYRFILAAGYEPKFYDVSEELGYPLSDIAGLIDSQTQMIFAVHFFGIPVDMEPLRKLADERNIFLLEDCAHTLNGRYKGCLLGTTGHFTIFSTRKMLQLHCGGFLLFNEQPWPFQPSRSEKVRNIFTGYHLLGSRVKFWLNRVSGGKNLLQKLSVPGTGYIDFSEKQVVNVKQMDLLSKKYFEWVDLEEMIQTRRENVRYLWNRVKRPELYKPIGFDRLSIEEKGKDGSKSYQLAEGYVPFSLPVLTAPGIRDYLQHKILEAGVVCYIGWPEAPFGMEGFPGSYELQARLLELPIHHYINRHQLKIMADCLNEINPEVV
jgi:hypothetical protein